MILLSEGWDGVMQEYTINGARYMPTDNALNEPAKVSPDDISYKLKLHSKFISNNPKLLLDAAKEIDALRKKIGSLREEIDSLREDFGCAVDDLGGALITIDCLRANLSSLKRGMESNGDSNV